MKENPLFSCDAVLHFDPIDLDLPGCESKETAEAVEATFEGLHVLLEPAVAALARAQSDYAGGLWGFVVALDGRAGFWYPLDCDTYNVSVDSNGFSHPFMPATAFGAGLTLTAVREYIEYCEQSARGPGALDANEIAELEMLCDRLHEFVLELAADNLLDGESFLGFID